MKNDITKLLFLIMAIVGVAVFSGAGFAQTIDETTVIVRPGAFRMDKNPGEHEVKSLRQGKLVRAAKFAVGGDGRIADNGVSRRNELGTSRMTIFAAVTGDADGSNPDLQAWKSTTFFGNSLSGFGQ